MFIFIDINQGIKPIVLHIGALFNTNNSFIANGQYDLQAAQTAIDDINLHSHQLFNGRYSLSLLSNNSKVLQNRSINVK